MLPFLGLHSGGEPPHSTVRMHADSESGIEPGEPGRSVQLQTDRCAAASSPVHLNLRSREPVR